MWWLFCAHTLTRLCPHTTLHPHTTLRQHYIAPTVHCVHNAVVLKRIAPPWNWVNNNLLRSGLHRGAILLSTILCCANCMLPQHSTLQYVSPTQDIALAFTVALTPPMEPRQRLLVVCFHRGTILLSATVVNWPLNQPGCIWIIWQVVYNNSWIIETWYLHQWQAYSKDPSDIQCSKHIQALLGLLPSFAMYSTCSSDTRSIWSPTPSHVTTNQILLTIYEILPLLKANWCNELKR